MDDILEGLDDIPNLMRKMSISLQKNENSTKKEQPSSNYDSIYVSSVLSNDPNNENKSKLGNESAYITDSIDSNAKKYEVSKIASIAKNKLLASTADGKDISHQCQAFDSNKRGHINYNEFYQLLSLSSSGLNSNEIKTLAQNIDTDNTGTVSYPNLIQRLNEIQVKYNLSSPQNDSSIADHKDTNPLIRSANSHPFGKNDIDHIVNKINSRQGPIMESNITSNIMIKNNTETVSPFPEVAEHPQYKQHQEKKPSNKKKISMKELYQEAQEKSSSKNWVIASTQGITPSESKKIAIALNNKESEGRTIVPSPPSPQTKELYRNPSKKTMTTLRNIATTTTTTTTPAKPSSKSSYDEIHSQSDTTDTTIHSNNNNENSLQSYLRHYEASKPTTTTITKTTTTEASSLNTFNTSTTQQNKIVEDNISNISNSKSMTDNNNNNNMIYNNVLIQVNGKLTRLRHAFKQVDPTRSGEVNIDEFRAAQERAGISLPRKAAEDLFHQHATNTNPTSVNTSTTSCNNRVVNVEAFLSELQSRAIMNQQQHQRPLSSTSKLLESSKSITETEGQRVLRKVLEGSSNITRNPSKVFRQYFDNNTRSSSNSQEDRRSGWLPENTLRSSLIALGVDLNDSEFQVLMQTIDPERCGKVDILSFDTLIHKSMNQLESKQIQSIDDLVNAETVSKTLQSNSCLRHHQQSLFDPMTETKDFRAERLRWTKLQQLLSKNQQSIKSVFAQQEVEQKPLHFSQLRSVLSSAGIPLGEEDSKLVEQYVARQVYSEGITDARPLTAETILKAAETPLLGQANTVTEEEGGLYYKKLGTQSTSSTGAAGEGKAATALSPYEVLEAECQDAMTNFFPGFKKRAVPQAIHPHHADPSLFWQMAHTDTKLFPTKCSSSNNNNPSTSTSKITSLSRLLTSPGAQRNSSRNMRSLLFTGEEGSSDGTGSGHGISRDTNRNSSKDSKRSSSAPPRSTMRQSNDSYNNNNNNNNNNSQVHAEDNYYTANQFRKIGFKDQESVSSPHRILDRRVDNIIGCQSMNDFVESKHRGVQTTSTTRMTTTYGDTNTTIGSAGAFKTQRYSLLRMYPNKLERNHEPPFAIGQNYVN